MSWRARASAILSLQGLEVIAALSKRHDHLGLRDGSDFSSGPSRHELPSPVTGNSIEELSRGASLEFNGNQRQHAPERF